MTDERTSASKSTEVSQATILHQAAVWLEDHPEIEIWEIHMDKTPILMEILALNTKEDAQRFVHLVGTVEKKVGETFLRLRHTPPGGLFSIEAAFYREVVCTAKVVGTKQVTKEVPLTFETQTITEDIIEWECGPLMEGN